MNQKDELSLQSEQLPTSVVRIEGAIESTDDLTRAERLTKLQDDSWVVHEVVTVWREQANSERDLRRTYAKALLAALFAEALFASTMFILLGCGVLTVSEWVANVFFAIVFGQIAAGVLAITRYLFPPGRGDVLIAELLRLRHSKERKNR
jgi:O-acetyl-ADP-ribose deacetylase (regulator of RNase III)